MDRLLSMGPSQSAESSRPSRQKRVGEILRQDPRDRLLQAAGEEFPVHGYAGTTVTRLAAAAGVSVQTLYLAWGSKRALLRGYMENALSGGASSPEDGVRRFAGLSPRERLGGPAAPAGEPPLPRFAGLAPRERLADLAALITEVAGRAATGWNLYRDAAAVDP